MLRNSGDYVERLVVATLSVSRISEMIFTNLARGIKHTSVTYINKVIEHILEIASANEGTVHAILGDNLGMTWNATHRTAHADVKAMRFMVDLDTAIKKEITNWQQQISFLGSSATADQQQKKVSLFDPQRSLISGGVVNGSGWCQLGGSAKRQHFMLSNFSDPALMQTIFEVGSRSKFVAVCRTTNQNTQHEFVFRGAGLHPLPGCEELLFGAPNESRDGRILFENFLKLAHKHNQNL